NPWAILLLGLCTILSVPLAVWGLIVTIRGTRVERPYYVTKSNNIVRNLTTQIPEVQIGYHGYGQPVENLTVTKLLFWNGGKEAIRKGDVTKADPLRIRVRQGCIILGVSTLYTDPVNQFTVTRSADR